MTSLKGSLTSKGQLPVLRLGAFNYTNFRYMSYAMLNAVINNPFDYALLQLKTDGQTPLDYTITYQN